MRVEVPGTAHRRRAATVALLALAGAWLLGAVAAGSAAADVTTLACPDELGGVELQVQNAWLDEASMEAGMRADGIRPVVGFRKLTCVYYDYGLEQTVVDLQFWVTGQSWPWPCPAETEVDAPYPVVASATHRAHVDIRGSTPFAPGASVTQPNPAVAAAAVPVAEQWVRAAEAVADPCGGAATAATPRDGTSAEGGTGAQGSSELPSDIVLIGGGAGLVALGAGPTALRAVRGRRPRGSALSGGSLLPSTDAFGDPIVVQDGTYAGGGNVGDVWWAGEWISPDLAREYLAEQQEAIRLRQAQSDQFAADSRAASDQWLQDRTRTLPVEDELARAAQQRAEATQALQRQRAHWESVRDQGLREHADWMQHSADIEAYERGLQWIQWGADRSIDILAGLTGSTGQTVKSVYDHAKYIGTAAGRTMGTGNLGASLRTTFVDYGIDKLTDHAVARPPGPSPFPSSLPRGLRDASMSTLGRVLSRPSGFPRTNRAIRDTVRDAAAGYGRDVVVRDPLRNLVEGRVPERDVGLLQGRDILTRTITDATGLS